MNAATGTTADQAGAQLYNVSSTKVMAIKEVWLFKTVATADSHELIRTTSRGITPGATITPDIDNDWERLVAPPSTAEITTSAYATYPTASGPPLARTNLPAAIGSGFVFLFGREGIKVVGGEGLAVAIPATTAMQISDVTYVWDE